MASNFLASLFLKIFNKREYLSQKYTKNLKKNVDFYNQNIRKKIEDIAISLKNKKKINFLHSGHLGDMIYSLQLIKELSKNYECNLFIQVNKKMNLYYHNHPSGDVMINNRSAKLMIPLLKSQEYLNTVKIYEKEIIDINLDLFREMPFSLTFHSVRWYSHLTGTPVNMEEKFLNLETNDNFKNKIVIVRSPRYRNNFIDYKFLKDVKNIVCVGLKEEYEDLKKDIENLEFYDCKDFLEMAIIINSSKFFIGNLCFAYSIAEALKIPRLLETCPDFPVVFPIGKNAFDFYHQIHFEKYFNELNKR